MNYGFYIGQKVVCITPNDKGTIKRGHKYNVHGLQLCVCGCGKLTIDVGVETSYATGRCSTSLKKFPNNNFYCANRFRPLITDSQEWAEELINEITIEIEQENLIPIER